MLILGIIILVVGITLLIVGKNVARSLPPNYQGEESDDFLGLLLSTGKLIGGAGVIFLVVGVICIVINFVG